MLQTIELIAESHSVVIRPYCQRLLSSYVVDIEISYLVALVGALVTLASYHSIGFLYRLHGHLSIKRQLLSASVLHEHTHIGYIQYFTLVVAIVIHHGKTLTLLSPLHLSIRRYHLCRGNSCYGHCQYR